MFIDLKSIDMATTIIKISSKLAKLGKKFKFQTLILAAGMEPTPRSLFLKAPTEFLSDQLDIGTRTLRIEFRTNRALALWISRFCSPSLFNLKTRKIEEKCNYFLAE